jgi:hypothetical protein
MTAPATVDAVIRSLRKKLISLKTELEGMGTLEAFWRQTAHTTGEANTALTAERDRVRGYLAHVGPIYTAVELERAMARYPNDGEG